MKEQLITTVTWGQHHSLDSLYGSQISIHSNGAVLFVNQLMPSGTVIQQWYSSTDFQSTRATPTLPFLYPKSSYKLDVQMTSIPDKTCLFDVLFFGRVNQLIGKHILHNVDDIFLYPDEAYYYTIRMINAGCDEFTFNSFSIMKVN